MTMVVPVDTGNREVNRILQNLIEAYEQEFAGCDLSYYLIGSWAEGKGTDLSDIDLVIVWTQRAPTEHDRALGDQVLATISSNMRLDVVMLTAQEVPASQIAVNLKLSGKLVHGPDIRRHLPLPTVREYVEETKQAAYFFMSHIVRSTDHLDGIDYPDPTGEFFGYTTKRVDAWYPPETREGLKELIATATRIARALVALQSGEYVASKEGAIDAYQTFVGDEWATYLITLYQKGKIEWAYRVPENDVDRELLRDLCRRFLAFERHFLEISGADVHTA